MVTLIAKVNPGCKKENISMQPNGEWYIKIRAKAIDGAANEYLIPFLANAFHLKKSDILIQKGHHNRIKKIQLNITQEQWDQVLSSF